MKWFLIWVITVAFVSMTGAFTDATMYDRAPLPPVEHRSDVVTVVSFETDVNEACGRIETLPTGQKYAACQIRGTSTMYVPNPCLPKYAQNEYARLLCHEIGHVNGGSWHED